jgi:hypothetical protein
LQALVQSVEELRRLVAEGQLRQAAALLAKAETL